MDGQFFYSGRGEPGERHVAKLGVRVVARLGAKLGPRLAEGKAWGKA